MDNALDDLVQQKIKELSASATFCKKVVDTLDTLGWKEIIEPLIDKMIQDVVGAKLINGRWAGGLLQKPEINSEYYIGYKQALIDLHTRIYTYKDALKLGEDERARLLKGPPKKFNVPMVDDTSYGRSIQKDGF